MKLKRAVSFLTLVAFFATCFVIFPGSSLSAAVSTPSNIYYAVDAQRVGGQVYLGGSGCSDKGQIAYFNQVGHSLTFTVNAQTKRTYCLGIRYSCGANNQKMTLSVNNELTAKLNFSYTGTWGESWKTIYKSVNLNQGQNKIVIRIDTGDGAANFDYIMLDTDNGEKTPNDLSDDVYFPGIGNQSGLNSCVTYSRVHTIYSYMVSRVNNLAQPLRLSPKWVYNRIGGYDKIHKILTENGCATLLEDPYPTGISDVEYNYPWNVEESTAKNALKYRLDPNYGNSGELIQHETTNSVNVIKNHIDNGRPISVTVSWPEGSEPFKWIWADNKDAVVAAKETGKWWHQVAIVGYDDDYICTYNNKTLQGAVKVANQHGDGWQRSGYIWVMYDALNKQSSILPETNGDRTSFFGSTGENELITYQALPSSAPELTAIVHVNTNNRSSFQVSFTGSSPDKEDKTITPYLTNYNATRGIRTFSGLKSTNSTYEDGVFAYNLNELSDYENISVTVSSNIPRSTGEITVNKIMLENAAGKVLSLKTPRETFSDTSKTYVLEPGYSINFNANGGFNAPDSQWKTKDETLRLSGTSPTKAGCTFLGWAVSPKATTPTYYPGGTFTENVDTTLYAVWQEGGVAAGGRHSFVLKSDGTVWGWGYNASGQLGDGTTTTRTTPVKINGLTNVVAVSAGDTYSVALKGDGTVWTWGNNGNGQLGDGTTTARSTPAQVPNLNNVIAVSAGYRHTFALKGDGTVWAWGCNSDGQLGNGSTADQTRPVKITALSNVSAIAGGERHSLALKEDGTVWSWGYNINGQLGNGNTTSRSTPAQIPGLSGMTAVSATYRHSMALKNDGTVWAWGYNSAGRLGDGTQTTRTTPVKVQNLSGVTAISTGELHSTALKSDGTVWAWGYNNAGRLGDGTETNRLVPVQAFGLTGIAALSTGSYHNMALRSNGSVYTWGYNDFGQIGNGTRNNQLLPTIVSVE